MRPDNHPPDWPPRRHGEPPHHSGKDARGAEINLRTTAQRRIFFGGLVAFVIFAVAMRVAGVF